MCPYDDMSTDKGGREAGGSVVTGGSWGPLEWMWREGKQMPSK